MRCEQLNGLYSFPSIPLMCIKGENGNGGNETHTGRHIDWQADRQTQSKTDGQIDRTDIIAEALINVW